MPTARRKCPKCGETNTGAAKFCMKCRSPMAETGSSIVWQRKPDDFATRVDIAGDEILGRTEIIVEEGTRAIVFVDGEYVQDLSPGRFEVEGDKGRQGFLKLLLATIGLPEAPKRCVVTAILVDAGDVELKNLEVDDLFTSDPLKVAVKTNLVIGVRDVSRFHNNVMKSRTGYSITDIENDVLPELHDAMEEHLGNCTASELNSNLDFKKELTARLERHLGETFDRNGLAVVQVRALRFEHGEMLLQVTKQEAENAGRTRLFDALNEAQLQKLYEETKKVELAEKRNGVLRRMRRAVTEDKMAELESGEEWEDFFHRYDRRKLLREEETNKLRQGVLDRADDHKVARLFLDEKLRLEHELGLQKIELVAKGEMDDIAVDREIARNRKKIEADVEEKRAKIKLGFEARERKDELDHERDKAKQELDEAAKDAETRRMMELIHAKSEIEREKIAADLKKTELLRDLPEERIMALMAGDSPDVAKAISERYKAQAEAKSAESEEIKDLYKDMFDRMERMHEKSLDAQAATAAGRIDAEKRMADKVEKMAEKSVDAGARVVAAAAAAGASIKCAKCGFNNKAGAKFCQGCGTELV